MPPGHARTQEGDWKPWHQGDNPWVAVQLKPVTAGEIPAVRKAEKSAELFAADLPDALECFWRVSAGSQPRGAQSQPYGLVRQAIALSKATPWLGECTIGRTREALGEKGWQPFARSLVQQ